MKILLFFAMLLCMASTTYAQCPDNATDDVRVVYSSAYLIPGGMYFDLCNGHSLHNEIIFQMNQDFNLGSSQTLWMNFGDGQTQQILDGEAVSHVYPLNSGGNPVTYNVQVILKETGFPDIRSITETMVIKSTNSFNNGGYSPPDEVWEISSPATYEPPVQGAFPPGSQFNGNSLGGAHAYIKYAPAHNGKLLKPLIFVDGIDFDSKTYTFNGEVIRHGDTGWDVLVMGADASAPNRFDVDGNNNPVPSAFSYYPTAFNTFLSEPNNYDIIFLDFGEGDDWIQKNGLELIELIKRVNEQKAIHAANGEIVCDNAVIGASMGGQVAKWALSTMEEQGINHQTHTYVSFDSPHRGAYLPPSLQAFALLSNRAHVSPETWESLNSPAARQMVMRHISAGLQGSGVELDFRKDLDCTFEGAWQQPDDIDNEYSGTADIRSGFQSEFAALGYPQMTRNVGISCGSRTGAEQGVPEGGDMFEAGKDVGVNPIQGICNAPGNEQLGFGFYALMRAAKGGSPGSKDVFHLSVCQHSQFNYFPQTIFAGFIPLDLISFNESQIPCTYLYLRARDLGINAPNFENASGCSRTDIIGLKKVMADMGIDVMTALDKFSFMPTLSTLDIQWPMDNEHLNMDFDQNDPALLALTPFDAVYAPEENLRHVELTPDMVVFVLDQLNIGLSEADATLNLTSGQTFNYGDRKNRVPEVTINNNARLAVNLTGKINYMTQQDPVANKPHFDVYTGGGCNQGKTVTVKNGGVLQIGDPGSAKTGGFHALAQSVIRVESGGTLRISNASTLHIYKGATLILDAGANVRLESPNASIQINGDLVVNGDINFFGPGYFDFAEGNQLVYGPGYDNFKLSGMAKDKRFVRLSADLVIEEGRRLNWSNGLLEAANGVVYLQAGAGLDFNLMTITGGQTQGLTAIEARNSGAVNLNGCFVTNLDAPIYGEQGLGCNIINCEFSKYFVGISWYDTWSVNVAGSIFTGLNKQAPVALKMTDVGFLLLNFSQFNDHIDPSLSGIANDGGLRNGIPAIELNNMVACLVKGTSFSRNSIGIKGYDPSTQSTANVYAFQGSSFVKNTAGIFVDGDEIQGAVLADCAYFIENRNGIRGKDITLMIDSKNTKMFDLDTDSPNHFIKKQGNGPGSTENHVKICYDLKAVGASNWMRNNFWGMTAGGPIIKDPNPIPILRLLDANCGIQISPPIIAEVASGNSICSYGFIDPNSTNFSSAYPGSECTLSVGNNPVNNEPITVHEKFHLGTYLMQIDSIEQAISSFRPVAALWQPNMYGYTSNCKQYIQVARAFVDARDQATANGLRPAAERAQQSTVGNLLIAPNPAENSALLQLPENQHSIKVWDAHGQICHQATASGTYRLDTSTWQQGIYFVETVAADGNRRSGKLVVQR